MTTISDIIKHIEEYKPFQIKIMKFGKPVLTTVHSDTVEQKINRIKKFSDTNNGVYSIMSKQSKNTSNENCTFFEEVSFGSVNASNNFTSSPVVDTAQIKKEIQLQLRQEAEVKAEFDKARRYKMHYLKLVKEWEQKIADLDTPTGKFSHVLETLIGNMMPKLMGSTMQGPQQILNGPTPTLSVDQTPDPNAELNQKIHESVIKLLNVMPVEDFILLCDTLASNPSYIQVLKNFIPKP